MRFFPFPWTVSESNEYIFFEQDKGWNNVNEKVKERFQLCTYLDVSNPRIEPILFYDCVHWFPVNFDIILQSSREQLTEDVNEEWVSTHPNERSDANIDNSLCWFIVSGQQINQNNK